MYTKVVKLVKLKVLFVILQFCIDLYLIEKQNNPVLPGAST